MDGGGERMPEIAPANPFERMVFAILWHYQKKHGGLLSETPTPQERDE